MNDYFSKLLKLRVLVEGLRELNENTFDPEERLLLTELTVPEGITRIGRNTFEYCRNLESVTLPNSLVEIDNSAFESCSVLLNVTFGNNLKIINDRVFYNCPELRSIRIPGTVKHIGNSAFRYAGLIKLEIEEGVEEIGGEDAFGCCWDLDEVILPNSIKGIKSTAFAGCNRIARLVVGRCFGGGAAIRIFGDAYKSLTEIVLTDDTITLSHDEFWFCSNHRIKSIMIKGKSTRDLICMANYPWGINDISIFKSGN